MKASLKQGLVPLVVLGCLVVACAQPGKPLAASGLLVDNGKGAAKPSSLKERDESREKRIQATAHYATGTSLELKGRIREAMDAYEAAGEANLADTALIIRVTAKLIRRKEIHRATTLLTKASKLPGASAKIDAVLGLCYTQVGKRQLARVACERALRKDPELLEGYRQLVTLHHQTGEHALALRLLERGAGRKGAPPAFKTGLAELFFAHQQQRAADSGKARGHMRRLLGEALGGKPKDAFVLLRIAESYRVLGDYDEAAKALELRLVALAQQPDLVEVRNGPAQQKQQQVLSRLALAEMYLQSNQPKKAKAQLEAVLKEQPKNLRAHQLMGFTAMTLGDHAGAVKHFEQVIALNPGMERAYFDLAEAQVAQKKPKDAVATLGKARKKFRASFSQEYFTANLYVRMKDYPPALKHFIAAEKMAKANAGEQNRLDHGFYFQMGAAYERNKKYEEAEVYFRESLKLKPDFASALNYLGYMWAEHGENLKEARRFIEKAVKLDPKNSAYLDSMAWVLYQQGDAKGALEWQLKALKGMEEEEPDAVILEHLGDIYHKLKQPKKAREYWEKSLKVEANPKVKERLEKLLRD